MYGYVTPLKLKIVLALALSDAVVRDADVISVRFFSFPPPLSSTFLPIACEQPDIQSVALGLLPRRG